MKNSESFDPQDTVKFIYCILDEIAGSVDHIGECQVTGLLPLLSRVESTFKYRHYQLSQALTSFLMDDFSTWCIYRLIVIACRPPFTYHLQVVGDLIRSLMLFLERHHLNIYLKKAVHLVSVLNDLLNTMGLFDQRGSDDFSWVLRAPTKQNAIVPPEDSKSDELRFHCLPIELSALREAYRLVSILSYTLGSLIASFHAYLPSVVQHIFRILCIAVELTDVHGKQKALDAIYQGTDALINLVHEPIYGSTTLNYIYAASGLVLTFLSSWHDRTVNLPSDLLIVDECTNLENTTVLCLRLLSMIEQRIVKLNQPGYECFNHQKLLNRICFQILESDWIKSSNHRDLKYAIIDFNLHFLSIYLLSNGKNLLCLLPFISNVDEEVTKCFEEDEYFSNPLSIIIPIEMFGIQYKSIISKILFSCDIVSVKEFLEAHVVKNPVCDDISQETTKEWIVFIRIWSGLSDLQSLMELKDIIQKLSAQSFHGVFDYLTKSIFFSSTMKPINSKKFATTYFGLRLLANAVITIQDFSLYDTSVLQSLITWLKNIKCQVKCDERHWIYICGPTISLLCSLMFWFSTANVMSAEELSDILVDYIMSYITLDEDHITIWLHYLLDKMSKSSSDGNFELAVKQCLFLKLFKFDFSNSSNENNADNLENLSLFEYIEFLSFIFDQSKVVENVDALINDFAVYLASHIRWSFMSTDQIRIYFTLIMENLCGLTPSTVHKIFCDTSNNLSKTNLNSWITVHKSIMELLNNQSNEKSTDISIATTVEYHIMIYGALGCCLASCYTDFMFNQKLQMNNYEFFCGRMSSETLGINGSSCVTSTQVIDLVVSILSILCRLGLVHQYSHGLFGTVYTQIQELILLLHLPSAQVIRLSDHQLAQIIVEHMDQSLCQAMESLSRLFRVDKKILFKELIAALFITLVIRGNQESHLRIRQLISEVPYLDSQQDYIGKIVQLCILPETLVYIFTRTSKDDQAVHLAFLEAHLNMSIERIARLNDISRLMHQFILRLYPYRVGACLGLRWISSIILPQISRTLADFLGHYVCGILAFFDNMLLNDDVILEHRWSALRSLVVFIKLLGSNHVTRMRAKFMANLKICMRYNTSPFGKVVVKAWRSFIRMLEPESLEELLPDLGATLVGLLSSDSDQVVDLFHYLFLEKRRATCFINSVNSTEAEFHQPLTAWLSALTHSKVNLGANDQHGKILQSRLWGLPSLLDRSISSAKGGEIRSMSSDTIHCVDSVCGISFRGNTALLADIVASLLEGLTRDTDEKMRLLYAQWLGNLGAVDPCKLYLSNGEVKTGQNEKESVIFVNDRRFPFHILCELAKIYLRAASPRQLDSAALAVQELLKLFKVPDVGKSNNSSSLTAQDPADSSLSSFFWGSELWNLFPEHLRDLFAPLLTSRYVVESFINWSAIRIPIITNEVDLNYESWIRLWSGSLSSHIKSPVVFNIFQFCEPVVKADATFARLMLEHSALQVLLDDSENGISALKSEILAVFTEVTESSHENGSHIEFDYLLKNINLQEDHPPSYRPWQPWFPLSVQTIFSLLDYLKHWLRIQQEYQATKSTVKSATAVQNVPKDVNVLQHAVAPSEGIERVSSFLSNIPNLLQAKASVRCGSFARALLHWELAYGEDTVAQQSAFVTGTAICRSNTDHTLGFTKTVPDQVGINSISSSDIQSTLHFSNGLGKTGFTILVGLLDTYASLHDSDGLAGVLSATQLSFTAFRQEFYKEKQHESKLCNKNMKLLSDTAQRFSLLRALELENEGQLDMAAAAYEHSLATSESSHRSSQCQQPSKEIRDNQHLLMYSGLFRCELPDPARLHGLVERAGALVRKSKSHSNTFGNSSVWVDCLNAHRAEAAWRLGDWETLQETTNMNLLECSWSVGLGRLFLAMKDKRTSDWSKILARLRIDQVTELGAAALEGPGGYIRAYDTIVRLSSLSDIELISSLGDVIMNEIRNPTNSRSSESNLSNIVETSLKLLETRIRVSRPTFHTLEPVLAIQHAALQLVTSALSSFNSDTYQISNREVLNSTISRLRTALGYNWLERAKLARKSGQFMAAYTCVLRAEDFGIPDALLERAKLLWKTDKREAAQTCLDKGIPDVFGCNIFNVRNKPSNENNEVSTEYRTISAQQALLLRTRYCEETNRYDFETTGKLYEQVCSFNSGYEEAHFRLARYVDRARTQAVGCKQQNALIKVALQQYGLALSYGSQFIYQSMPRLLTLWLDYGQDSVRNSHELNKSQKHTEENNLHSEQKVFNEVQELMRINCQRIPVYQFYTALSQLLSRVCHEIPTVVTTLIALIVRIFETYPLQTMWFLIPLNDSTVRQRRDRCQQIFNMIKTKQPHLSKFIADSIALCNHLKTVCGLFMTADRRELRNFSLRQTVRPITRLIESSEFSRILIPIHRQLVPNHLLPNATPEQIAHHWPFAEQPDRLVCLTHIEDTVEILGSQTRPKKMTWVGSDGREYIIVAKPNDDLRKDSRLMELNGMINKFLVINENTRRRALQIRTYAVIPLSEKGGLIEWVRNTQPFRSIITRLYNEIGKPINWANMSRVAPLLEDPLSVKRDKYLNKWLPMFPLVFYNWFLSTFSNPSSWYSGRECYARTCAVMSMVGYVLGLGDRHTENILFDSISGDLVHVDFSCVFNNGLTLPWPERVPFRLTRNMVHAMGPTGYEGTFRRCSEAVMRLLRHEIDPLLAVFRPIYFDAVVEQTGNVRNGSASSDLDLTERATRAATEKLARMEDRLKGKITEHDGFSQILPMSVEGQVDTLIKEATDVDRLCQMYKGWMPFL
ncbi:putative phosphatidylinositol 3-and 4-kinase [Schistosoma mansoni]|uniref:putative phosphatidylinositol 3-and 4-kinase n=1 Tax=Schistosoma mansoni TaxID=6183 RepID=UPI00022DC9F2|nr:putative phosphatidylinositol 3-and 4-kinase [Schistosoma mansoni]|eukprot:XP_018655277.1 putative phosphatidylinositol 3-and 4-kinase [Schistosoma mansoni]